MNPENGNKPYLTRERILELFAEVDKELGGQPKIEVFVVGYSALVLARKGSRGSNDVDIIPSRFSRAFSRYGFEVFDEHYFYLPSDYKTRAQKVEREYDNLAVRYADPHDIWFTKLAAFRNKDRFDMIRMIRERVVDVSVLDRLFDSWNRHWFDGSAELEANFAEVKHEAACQDRTGDGV